MKVWTLPWNTDSGFAIFAVKIAQCLYFFNEVEIYFLLDCSQHSYISE